MVVDASVVVSRLVPHDLHHEASRRWLTDHVAGGGLLISPTLSLAEVAGAVSRRTGNPQLARRAVTAVLRLPGLRLVVVDELLARAAASLAGRLRVRGADSGPWAISNVRDMLVHPRRQAALGLPSRQVRIQATYLALWYIEVALLALCQYDGVYVNRLHPGPTVFDATGSVPWARTSPPV